MFKRTDPLTSYGVARRSASSGRFAAGRFAVWAIPAIAGLGALITLEYWLPEPLPARWATEARQVDAADRAVCERFGFLFATDPHAACAEELRHLHERDRDASVSDLL